jgi:7,8-dihydroneopterin aldolase/epimerase/oxygenase
MLCATSMQELIRIHRLKISTHIGVPDEERASPQELCVNIEMEPRVSFADLRDEIRCGVDYHQVSLHIEKLASASPRKLIETLALDIAEMILRDFAVAKVKVEIEKYILSNADFVAVSILRSRHNEL